MNMPNQSSGGTALPGLVAELKQRIEAAAAGGGAEAENRHRARGRLPVRVRIDRLVDPGAPFLELSALAAHGMYDDAAPGAGLVTGIGLVAGRPCMIVANDPTVKGGTYFPLTVKKHVRAQTIALENALPCLYLVESGGANLPHQAEVFPDRDHFGRIFRNQAQLSAAGLAQIAVVFGSCTAGGAYVPAMADQAIIVRGQGTIFLGGPPLVKAATGETISAEALGGADVHARQSGVVDHVADDDDHAIRLARRLVGQLPGDAFAQADAAPQPPRRPASDLDDIVPADLRQPVRHERRARMPDRRQCIPGVQAGLWRNAVDGVRVYLRLPGRHHCQRWHSVFRIRPEGRPLRRALLPARHSHCCSCTTLPVFMVGRDYEAGGIAKDGAKMVMAVACAQVPKLSLIVGGSFGAGNYAMCGRAYDPRFLWTWPSARISVMGGDQAASVLATVRRDALDAKGQDWPAEEEAAYKAPIRARYEQEGSPYYATARLWDDGILDPARTRDTLGLALALAKRRSSPPTRFGVFRM